MQLFNKAILVAATFALGLVGTTAVVSAADEAENVIKYRQKVMGAIGGHMGAIAGIAKGEVSFVDDLSGHAHAINEMSQNLARLFPAGTGPDVAKTRALPAIWEQTDKWNAAVKALQDESAKLIEVAKGGDMAAIGAQVGALGKNGCGGCHKPFRAEKK